MSLESLKRLESKHLDYMTGAMIVNCKDADRQIRYVGYIQDAIKKHLETLTNK